ncbi:MAG: hypothetical protein U0Y82_11610 [Thermoleophilia bacterium]
MAKPMEGEDPFAFVDRLLEEQQMKHFELAGLVAEYRQHFADTRENPTHDAVTLARGLPGAKYRVNAKFVEENWLVLEAELKRMFPRD